ncbi:Short coiled-coil [Brachionus plicatilis]|uniref:Short coiled-coil n=1 Tax=Brachionus plicatilis TaxID=10195 RepID=A0A3M7RK66_BRAPC|nr:Short coiled-coil [Brachionus plicatilis]
MNASKNLTSESDSDSISNNSQISSVTTGNNEEDDEKQRLIERILELQSTLEDLSNKVNEVKEENLKLKSENQILNGYMENLMNASNSFQSAWKKPDKQ